MKAASLTLAIILFAFVGFTQIRKHIVKKKPPVMGELTLKNSLDSISYAYGMDLYLRRNASLIKDLKAKGLKTLNFAAFNLAISDALADKSPMLTPEQKLTATLKFVKEKYTANLAEANKFMAENKTKPGVVTTPSGLQYMVLQEGTGPRLQLTDTIITTNYALSLATTGKEVESTFNKKPFVLPAVKGVIPGWIEGLQLMNVGAKYRLFIPYQLAYGDSEASAQIPPYSALVFDLELVKIGK
jgi:FKBP-type peptidyl-prolyl cis-trans isomerase